MPQAPCGAGLRPLTPTRQVATILYRLEGGTMGFNQHKNGTPKLRIYHYLPLDCVPIPYTLTDFGRAFLAELRAKESVAVLEPASPPDSGLPLPQPVARRSRSPRKR